MTIEIAEIMRTMSPEYQRTFTEGFEAGKRHALRVLKKAEKEIQDAEAFSTSASTVSTR